MEIKLDSDNGCQCLQDIAARQENKRFLYPVVRTAYLHAVKITSETQTSSTTLDASTTVTVKGH